MFLKALIIILQLQLPYRPHTFICVYIFLKFDLCAWQAEDSYLFRKFFSQKNITNENFCLNNFYNNI